MPHTRILVGDVRTRLRSLPDNTVHCAVTSPPYWNLRDYSAGETWDGGDPQCDHVMRTANDVSASSTLGGRRWDGQGEKNAAFKAKVAKYRKVCRKCGATRAITQIGLEPTPQEYVETMVHVCREVRRVLRDDGTFWLNIGDTYSQGSINAVGSNSIFKGKTNKLDVAYSAANVSRKVKGLPAKNIVGIPWLVAFALQADGWILRKPIIWAKRNSIPESVTDRTTCAHEYIFHLTKSPQYYYDQHGCKEGGEDDAPTIVGIDGSPDQFRRGRNMRDVWWMSSEPYAGGHYAPFPSELPERCIRLGTSEHGCCTKCGTPWQRVLEQINPHAKTTGRNKKQAELTKQRGMLSTQPPVGMKGSDLAVYRTTGWEPSCSCHETDEEVGAEPCIVLDPFGGSGTTAVAANRLGRNAILCELSEEYAGQAKKRILTSDRIRNRVTIEQAPRTPERMARKRARIRVREA